MKNGLTKANQEFINIYDHVCTEENPKMGNMEEACTSHTDIGSFYTQWRVLEKWQDKEGPWVSQVVKSWEIDGKLLVAET